MQGYGEASQRQLTRSWNAWEYHDSATHPLLVHFPFSSVALSCRARPLQRLGQEHGNIFFTMRWKDKQRAT